MLLSFTVLVSVFVVYFLPPSVIDLSSSGSVEFHWGTLGIVGIPAGVHVWVSSWHHAFPPSSGLISPQALTHWGFLYALCLCFCSTVFPANILLCIISFFLALKLSCMTCKAGCMLMLGGAETGSIVSLGSSLVTVTSWDRNNCACYI